jgi:hypothetical protein
MWRKLFFPHQWTTGHHLFAKWKLFGISKCCRYQYYSYCSCAWINIHCHQPNPLVFTDLDPGPPPNVNSGTVTVTYASGVNYNITMTPTGTGTTCNPITLSGTAPVCCVPPECTITGPTPVCPSSTNVYCGPVERQPIHGQ